MPENELSMLLLTERNIQYAVYRMYVVAFELEN